MPPKVRITKEDIIATAVNIARREGIEAINARAIASDLSCSTQPIFSNFSDMEVLKGAVLKSSFDIYLKYLDNEVNYGEYPTYKAMGIAYIRFAIEERNLFKMLFMKDRTGEKFEATSDFNESVNLIMKSKGLSRERAERIHLELWSFVHGIAVMHATSFLILDWEKISEMLSDVYNGIISKAEEEKA